MQGGVEGTRGWPTAMAAGGSVWPGNSEHSEGPTGRARAKMGILF